MLLCLVVYSESGEICDLYFIQTNCYSHFIQFLSRGKCVNINIDLLLNILVQFVLMNLFILFFSIIDNSRLV